MKRSLSSGAGYLQIDHRDSPGIRPEDVAHVPGIEAVGPGQNFETGTLRCNHCATTVVLNPQRKRPRAYCPKCDHYICDSCDHIRVKTGECKPIMAQLQTAYDIAAKAVAAAESQPEPKIVLTDKE